METKRRYIIAALFLILTGVSCKGKHNPVTVQNEQPDDGRRMVSTVRMNDSKAGAQLLSGFYSVEDSSWRWTAGKFSVILRTPLAAAQRGGTLSLAFSVPDVVIRTLNNVTITASINGMALRSAEFNAAGSYVFSADVPASMLTTETVKVDFALDKSLPAGVDKRELGIIATSVALSPR